MSEEKNQDFVNNDGYEDTTEEQDEYVSGADYQAQLNQLPTQTTHRRQRAGWKQKIAVVVLALFGVITLLMWAAQFASTLVLQPPGGDSVAQQGQLNAEQNNTLRAIDTDGDGLSDYDELNFYNTSPYLDDSDSDGTLDKQEIDDGTDPNCPEGQNCFNNSATVTTAPNAGSNLAASANTVNPESFDPDQEAIYSVLSGDIDAAQLRQFLREAGMSAELLEQVSDEQLLAVYESTLQSQGGLNSTDDTEE